MQFLPIPAIPAYSCNSCLFLQFLQVWSMGKEKSERVPKA
jgi:hypothetical protein